MSVTSDVAAWLEHESPGAEEIKQTIDNLAFQHSVAGQEQRAELEAVIFQLCERVGLAANAVALAPAIGASEKLGFDLRPLASDAMTLEELPAMDRAKRFRELKELLERPF